MLEKAKQVKVKEILENDEIHIFGAIQIGDKLIAMDNGDILDAKADWIEIIEELPWITLSDEMLAN